jgi:8-oxo-dGTP diphosphatase
MRATGGFTYKHPHPAVAVDVVTFSCHENVLKVLLVQRGVDPFKDRWAIPGGFLKPTEDLAQAARREVAEETGLVDVAVEQIGAFGDPNRDPRERVVSVAHLAVVRFDDAQIRAGSDAAKVAWHPFWHLPKLAFDHAQIAASAHEKLVQKLRQSDISLRFLGPEFTLTELQGVHEAILGSPVDKRNFRKWVSAAQVVKPTKRRTAGGAHRPARIYVADPAWATT